MIQIEPFLGVGIVQFGLHRDEVHAPLGDRYHAFRKTPRSVADTEAYDEIGLHLYYDEEGRLRYIEALAGSEINYAGVPLVGKPLDQLVHDLKGLGVNCDRSDHLYVFRKLGCVTSDPGTGTCESIVVHDRESFDRYMEKEQRRREKLQAIKSEMQKKGPIKDRSNNKCRIS